MQLSQRDKSPELKKRTLERRLLAVLAGGIVLLAGIVFTRLLGGDPAVSSIFTSFAAAGLSAPVLFKGFRSLYSRRNTTDILVAIAVGAALALQEYGTAGAVSFFLLGGGLLEERTASGAREAVKRLVDLAPVKARLKSGADGSMEEVDAASLEPGQVVIVLPGDILPSDGEVIGGCSAVDQSSITGESIPVEVKPGDEVFAGAANLSGSVEVRVTRAGDDSVLGKINLLIEEASRGGTRFGRFVDSYAGYYTPILLLVASGLLYFTGDMNRAIGALIVACPCAFVLASPLACMAGLAAAARMGLMVKRVDNLETAALIDTVVFDKTGTLTTGKLSVYSVEPTEGIGEAELLMAAGSALALSNHPVANGVLKTIRDRNIQFPDPRAFKEEPGSGCRASGPDFTCVAGRRSYLEKEGVTGLPSEPPNPEETGTFLLVALDGEYAGMVRLRDTVRPDLETLGEDLRRLGVKRTIILTGDREQVAREVAADLEFDEFYAELMPDEKVAVVEKLRKEGCLVSVVGDGVNDAPALAAGDLGLAVGSSGSGVAILAADVVFLNDDVARLPWFISLARRSRAVIVQNILIAVGFTFGALSLVAAGYIAPVAAAFIHNSSTLLIAVNSSRLMRSSS